MKLALSPLFLAFSTAGHCLLRASLSTAVRSSLKLSLFLKQLLFFNPFQSVSPAVLDRNLMIMGRDGCLDPPSSCLIFTILWMTSTAQSQCLVAPPGKYPEHIFLCYCHPFLGHHEALGCYLLLQLTFSPSRLY